MTCSCFFGLLRGGGFFFAYCGCVPIGSCCSAFFSAFVLLVAFFLCCWDMVCGSAVVVFFVFCGCFGHCAGFLGGDCFGSAGASGLGVVCMKFWLCS